MTTTPARPTTDVSAALPGSGAETLIWIADDLLPAAAPRDTYTIGTPVKGKSWTARDVMRFWAPEALADFHAQSAADATAVEDFAHAGDAQ